MVDADGVLRGCSDKTSFQMCGCELSMASQIYFVYFN